jgi:ribosomal protein L11 methyltransferase
VDAVDVDPQAIETTRANALANKVRLNAALPETLPAAAYDIVVANILAQPLIVLAPLLAQRARRIALSGILEDQVDEVRTSYEPHFRMRVDAIDERWALLVGERK